MAVSSKSIIHYTDSLDNLKNIIDEGGLRIKYCAEEIYLYDNWKAPAAFPMVCFCDLPLTLAKEHIVKYGSYGIGFSKTWARENRLNPVFYLEKNSTISQYITEQTDKYMGPERRKLVDDNPTDDAIDTFNKDKEEYARLLAFCKNHVGPLIRKGAVVDENYIFYDEREWRYVPQLSDLEQADVTINREKYYRDKEYYNSLLTSLRLRFDYSDISYIIVKDEEDINAISIELTKKYGEGLTPPNMRKLLTKIVSVQQIADDF
jgi:hypothetical protein